MAHPFFSNKTQFGYGKMNSNGTESYATDVRLLFFSYTNFSVKLHGTGCLITVFDKGWFYAGWDSVGITTILAWVL